MTAHRVIDDHNELENSGVVSHSQLDSYVNNTPWIIVSGTSGPTPPNARNLVAGPGITIIDSGPGGDLVLSASSASGEVSSIYILSGTNQPAKNGEITYISGSGFRFFEQGVIRELGINANEHAALRQLAHFADDSGPFETFASSFCQTGPIPFPTASIWYTDNSMTQKIVEQLVTYNSNRTISQIQWRVYASDGVTPIATATDNITYSGIFETSRTRTIT